MKIVKTNMQRSCNTIFPVNHLQSYKVCELLWKPHINPLPEGISACFQAWKLLRITPFISLRLIYVASRIMVFRLPLSLYRLDRVQLTLTVKVLITYILRTTHKCWKTFIATPETTSASCRPECYHRPARKWWAMNFKSCCLKVPRRTFYRFLWYVLQWIQSHPGTHTFTQQHFNGSYEIWDSYGDGGDDATLVCNATA